jgi:hypothetical protein
MERAMQYLKSQADIGNASGRIILNLNMHFGFGTNDV